MEIQIFDAEKSIASQILNNLSIAYTIEPKLVEKEPEEKDIAIACSNTGQPDLYYLIATMVSTNWNANDDIFTPEETWKARSTPVNKQFNFMHNEKDIIGHITSSSIIVENEVYASQDMPSFFDIDTDIVLYKKWSDPQLQERMNNIIAEIAENKWFVSMEALFTNFDYALLKDDQHKIIPRNEATAFLTRHLRAYGGSGVYNDYRIGRVLKNITFSGQGLVNKPANKRSLIKSYSFNGTFASLKDTFGSNLMDTVSKVDYDKVVAQLENFKAEAEKAKAKEIESYKTTVAELEEKNKTLASEAEAVKSKLETVEALSKEKTEKLESVEAEMKEKDKKMSEMKDSMDKMKKDKAKADRVSLLVSAGVDSKKAEEVVAKFESADDSMFSEVVALYTDKEKMKKEDKEKAMKDKSKAEDSEEADASELDNVEKETSAGLGQEEDESDEDKMVAKASAWLQDIWSDNK